MRWRLADRSVQDLSDDERLRDALNAVMGYECRQLRYSFRTSQLLLRSPEQQRNLSESYLLLALGHLGCLYRELQHQQKQLQTLGSGLALDQRQREELLLYKQFHRKYQKLEKPATLFQLWKSNRNFSSKFELILDLNCLIFEEASLLNTLSKELYQGNYENLLQNWLLLVSQTMLEHLSRWLRFGELLESESTEFFLIENLTLPTENFWQGRFTLLTKIVPLFLSNELCHLILNVGKCHRYSKEFLEIDIEVPLNYQKLAKAFQLTYLNHNMEPLNDLVAWVNQDISSYIFSQHDPAIDLLYRLFNIYYLAICISLLT
ncbi:gamma-tubulin complex component 3-like [Drosophila willistoni]|uniref:gamma-tubulin complex component 3-like n=1 Tax=Drosophila willistoni TaxID=7260 RepID=UPI001F07848D|nr:gamma-tubulin complex component 3-like [Drosophila willistoni]XP_046869256.1 gamma-tubulin complex component 3-like [Drosophila willistoni]